MRLFKHLALLIVMIGVVLAGCDSEPIQEIAAEPTSTLLPILSETPRYTATPQPSRTPLPTFTFTPSETPIPPTPTLSLTPSPTPVISGIVQSLQRVNVREGPSTTYSAFESLPPGSGVVILAESSDGRWYNIRFENDEGEIQEGWMATSLIFVEDTPTPVPTTTPSPDLTALYLGTPLPTAILGGGTVTPTPPRSISTATPIGAESTDEVDAEEPTSQPFIPVVDIDSIDATATALAGVGLVTSTPTLPVTESPTVNVLEVDVDEATNTPAGPTPIPPPGQPTVTEAPPTLTAAPGAATVQQDVRVFAFCDDLTRGNYPAPTDLAAGSTIVIWWSWFASTEQQVRDHLNNATIELRVEGELIQRVSRYAGAITKPANDYVVTYTVPYDTPLEAGQHTITYRVTWQRQITDGYQNFGPGTLNPVEEGSCTFVVK